MTIFLENNHPNISFAIVHQSTCDVSDQCIPSLAGLSYVSISRRQTLLAKSLHLTRILIYLLYCPPPNEGHRVNKLAEIFEAARMVDF